MAEEKKGALAKKADPKAKVDPKAKEEPKKDEAKKDEAKKEEPKKDEAKKEEPKKDEAKKEEPKEAPKPAAGGGGGRAARTGSNIYAKIPQKTMQEMKEAFTMIDQNRDGIIDLEDLKDMYSNLGRIPPDAELNEMLKEAPGALNFTTFLNLFGEKLSGTDPETTIIDAFAMFDDEAKGWLPEEYLKDLLQNMGDNFTQDEIKQTWKEANIEKGRFDYKTFTGLIKGKQSEDEIAA